MYENIFDYTDVDGDKLQTHRCTGEYYFKVNCESVELPTEVISKMIEVINEKCR